MSHEIKGKIIAILPKRSGVTRTGNTWASQEYVLETQEQYPRRLLFEAYGEDKIMEFYINDGDIVNVKFDCFAHQYNGRWYNCIRAWEVEHLDIARSPELKIGDSSNREDRPF